MKPTRPLCTTILAKDYMPLTLAGAKPLPPPPGKIFSNSAIIALYPNKVPMSSTDRKTIEQSHIKDRYDLPMGLEKTTRESLVD